MQLQHFLQFFIQSIGILTAVNSRTAISRWHSTLRLALETKAIPELSYNQHGINYAFPLPVKEHEGREVPSNITTTILYNIIPAY